MNSAMTFREMNLNVFRGGALPFVFFQPRFEPWYHWQKKFRSLPPGYEHMAVEAVYDALRVSERYVDYGTGMPSPVVCHPAAGVTIHSTRNGKEMTRVYETPQGQLVEKSRFTVDETWRVIEFAVKTPEDLKILRALLPRLEHSYSAANFEKGSRFLGARGEPQFWLPKSPYQALAQQWMKLDDFIFALADAPAEVEETMKVIDANYDRLYEEVIASGQVKIVNFGENIHDHLTSPRYFERYLIPWYEKRSGQLRKAGLFTHVHIDGYFRSLLKYLKHLPFDGLEALTPKPQGDVTLEEMKEHLGDKVLLDGIPAVFFLPTYSSELLLETVEKLVALFHPRLVLGVSDEVPQGADAAHALEKLRLVSEWCRKFRSAD